jgi:hypothetical protein
MKHLTLALPLLLLAACTTKKEMLSLPSDTGVKGTYKEPFEQVKKAALDALAELGFKHNKDIPSDEFTFQVLYSQGLSTGTAGRYVRVTITKGDTERVVYFAVRSKTESDEARKLDEVLAKDLHARTATRLAPK